MPETFPLVIVTGSPDNGIIASARTNVVEASSAPASEIAAIRRSHEAHRVSPCVLFFDRQNALFRTDILYRNRGRAPSFAQVKQLGKRRAGARKVLVHFGHKTLLLEAVLAEDPAGRGIVGMSECPDLGEPQLVARDSQAKPGQFAGISMSPCGGNEVIADLGTQPGSNGSSFRPPKPMMRSSPFRNTVQGPKPVFRRWHS